MGLQKLVFLGIFCISFNVLEIYFVVEILFSLKFLHTSLIFLLINSFV